MRPEFITWKDPDDETIYRCLNTHYIESMHQHGKDVKVFTTADADESYYRIPNVTIEELIKQIGTLALLVGQR